MNPPTTLPEALEQIAELEREVKGAQADAATSEADAEEVREELEELQSSTSSPAGLLAFADKWARQRNGFTGHAAGNLCFATIDHQGKRFTAHGKGILDAISACEDNFRQGNFCRTSIQLPVHA